MALPERLRLPLFLLFIEVFILFVVYTSSQATPKKLDVYAYRGVQEISSATLMLPYAFYDDRDAFPKDLGLFPQICPDSGKFLDLLIVVISTPGNFEKRMAIRKTWGSFSSRPNVAMVFVLGASNNHTLNTQVDNEKFVYSDIISYNFYDSIKASAYKSISTLYWIGLLLPNFVLKTEDDMFINVNQLLYFLNHTDPNEIRIYGKLEQNWIPNQALLDTFLLLPQFHLKSYPDFTSGAAYLFPAWLARSLHAAGRQFAYASFEDVIITGFAANKLNVSRVNEPTFLIDHVLLDICDIQKTISVRTAQVQEQYSFWAKILTGGENCD